MAFRKNKLPFSLVELFGEWAISGFAGLITAYLCAEMGTENGSGIPPVYMPGASGQGQRALGQFNQEGFVRILEPNTEYMVHIINNGSVNPANIEWYLLWVELNLPA